MRPPVQLPIRFLVAFLLVAATTAAPATIRRADAAAGGPPGAPATAIETAPDPTAGDATAHTVAGRVTIADSTTGLAGATVNVCSAGYWFCATVAQTTTAADGSYRTDAVPDGDYQILVEPGASAPAGLLAGWYSWSAPSHYVGTFWGATIFTVHDDDLVGIDLGLRYGHRIGGRITAEDGGPAVARATIDIYPCDYYGKHCSPVASTTTSSTGDWSTDLVPPGSYTVRVSSGLAGVYGGWYTDANAPHYASVPEEATDVAVADADVMGIDVALSSGHEISGRVTLQATGEAIAGIPVSICVGYVYCDTVTTDSSGDWVHGPLPNGSYGVRFGVPDPNPLNIAAGVYSATDPNHYAPNELQGSGATPVVVLGGDVTRLDVGLPAGHRVTGTVTAAGSGAAVADAFVMLCAEVTRGSCLHVATDRTATDGSFTLGPVIDASGYTLVVYAPDPNPLRVLPGWYATMAPGHYTMYLAEATRLTVAGVDVDGLTLALAIGHTISGRITDARTGLGIEGVAVTVNDCADGIPFCSNLEATVRRDSEVVTDADGRYETGILPDDSYQLSVRVDDPVLEGWYTTANRLHFTTLVASETRIVLRGADRTGIDLILPASGAAGGTWTTPGRASGAGHQSLAEGRVTFEFRVNSVAATATNAPAVSGRIRWRQEGAWRFTGTATGYRVDSGFAAVISGSGVLERWVVTAGRGRWTAATVGPAQVSLIAWSGDRGRGDPGTGPHLGIWFEGTRAEGIPLPPSYGPMPLDGGTITLR